MSQSVRTWINKSLSVFNSLVPQDADPRELTPDALTAAFEQMGIDPPADVDQFLASADSNKNAKIDSNEFLKLVGKLLDPKAGSLLQSESALRKWADMLKAHQVMTPTGEGGAGQPSSSLSSSSLSDEEQTSQLSDSLDMATIDGASEFVARCFKNGCPRLLFTCFDEDMAKDTPKSELTSWFSFASNAAAVSDRSSATKTIVSVDIQQQEGTTPEDDPGAKLIVVVQKSPFATVTYKIKVWFTEEEEEEGGGKICGLSYDSDEDKQVETKGGEDDFFDNNEYNYFVCVARGTVDHQHFAWHIDVPHSVKLGCVGCVKPYFPHQELRKFQINVVPRSRIVKASADLANINLEKCDPGATTIAATTFSGPCHVAVEYDAACMQRYVACLPKSASEEEVAAFKKKHVILPPPPQPPRPSEVIQPHKTASTAAFQNWMQEGGVAAYDREKESVVSFCVRIIRHLAKTIKYDCTEETLNKRSSLASIVKWGKTDCGGHTQLFTNVCAINGLMCREALSYTHVYPEVYIDDSTGWFPCDAVVKDVNTILDEEQTVILQSQGNEAIAEITDLLPNDNSDDDEMTAGGAKKKKKKKNPVVVDAGEIPRIAEEFTRTWYAAEGGGVDALARFMHPYAFKDLKGFMKECRADAGPVKEIRKECKVLGENQLVIVYTHNEKCDNCIATLEFDVRSDKKLISGVGAWMGCDEPPAPPEGYTEPEPLGPPSPTGGEEGEETAANRKTVLNVGGQVPSLEVLETREKGPDESGKPEFNPYADGAWLFQDFVRGPANQIDLSPGDKFLFDYGFTFPHVGKLPRPIPTEDDFAGMDLPPVPGGGGGANAGGGSNNNNNKPQPLDISPEREQQIRTAFDNFDDDDSGELDKTEAMAAFLHYFPNESAAELRDRIVKADCNSDGKLSFAEFAAVANDVFAASECEKEECYDEDG